jgi:hypothetical protein
MVGCEKTVPCDADGDGFPSDARPRVEAADDACAAAASDCDDGNAAISPAAAEQPYDGVDNDCDATTVDDDLDGDGFILVDDCDDGNAAISPAAAEQPYDGVDNDCDATTVDDDVDGDGFVLADDCDDASAAISPAAEEQPYDGVDNDCDATTVDDDLDGDGFVLADDCDDSNAETNPAAAERCDGVDNDCDGVIDPTTSIDAVTVFADADGDGLGDPASAFIGCPGAGASSDPSDPDDSDPRIPGTDLPSGGVELAPCPNFSGVYSGATQLYANTYNESSGIYETAWGWAISEMTGDDTVREFRMTIRYDNPDDGLTESWDRWMRCDADGLWLLYEAGHWSYWYPYIMGYRYQSERIWETEYADGLLVLPADAAPGYLDVPVRAGNRTMVVLRRHLRRTDGSVRRGRRDHGQRGRRYRDLRDRHDLVVGLRRRVVRHPDHRLPRVPRQRRFRRQHGRPARSCLWPHRRPLGDGDQLLVSRRLGSQGIGCLHRRERLAIPSVSTSKRWPSWATAT